MPSIDDLARRAAGALGPGPGIRCVAAPGRVNLIGDHTDYCEGFVLPLAIDRACVVAWRERGDGRVVVRSLEAEDVPSVAADGGDDPRTVEPRWGRFVAGVVRALARAGRAPVGLDAVVTSSVPPGAGLSSSSALSVALTMAAASAGKLDLDRRDVARAALEGEVLATGVPGGLMDQLASLFGRPGRALLIDCRTLAVDPVPLPDTHAVLVVHSGVERALGDSAYAERRAACERAARRVGVATLRDAQLTDVADDPRARHVVSENRRVLEAAVALRAGDVSRIGTLMIASHASLRDDFEVSTPELDLLVELLLATGAVGARLTGAGFGGCVVALVQRNHADDVAAKTVLAYGKETGLDATAFVVRAAAGAADVDV
jgi:galactokinase